MTTIDQDAPVQAPQEMLPVEAARSRIVAAMPRMPADELGLAAAAGRVAAETIIAAVSHPPLPVSAMDGYACRAADVNTLPARLPVLGVSKAGEPYRGDLPAGGCVRIFTGAAVPSGADVIALQEDVVALDGVAEIAEVPRPGQFIRPAGQDILAGEPCIRAGRRLNARDLAVIATSGHGTVPVRRRPRVAILSTGDELVAPGSRDYPPDRIMASNGVALAAAVSAWGAEPIDLGVAADDRDVIARAIADAPDVEVLVTTGGASVGDHDLVHAALVTLGFDLEFWKIAMRPGKPLMFGHVGRKAILALPGNPVSALVCAHLFLRPAIAAMLGAEEVEPRFERAVLQRSMPANDRREDYVRARLATDPDGRLLADPYPMQDSGMIAILAAADGLIRRRPLAPAAQAGDVVDVIPLSDCGC